MLDISNKVVYQIYPKSFNDSNGDGWGDLPGITQKLDYLKQLGIDYLWITPFFVSPQKDNGYDVADYRSIDPRFGTMEEFEELSREAHARDIGIMLDMVFNHVSSEHEWFQRAIAGDKRYQDYFFLKRGHRVSFPATGIRSLAVPPGPGNLMLANGTCTYLTRANPTSTGKILK